MQRRFKAIMGDCGRFLGQNLRFSRFFAVFRIFSIFSKKFFGGVLGGGKCPLLSFFNPYTRVL
jgi:hypothetical protein